MFVAGGRPSWDGVAILDLGADGLGRSWIFCIDLGLKCCWLKLGSLLLHLRHFVNSAFTRNTIGFPATLLVIVAVLME